ncbi:MAG: ExbD/TolR family protein [Paracoccaceae bacterium]
MAIRTALRRRKRLSMTSLIDVIFLLLLFFMLTSTFSKYGEVEIAAGGQGGTGSSEAKPHFLSMKAEGLLLNGLPMQLADLAEALKPGPDRAERFVLISLSDQTSSQELVDTLTTLRGIGGGRTVGLQ